MVDIVGIIGPGGEGGTFLDWTLHYLSGDRFFKYVLVDRSTNIIKKLYPHPVLHDPITPTGNAHNHHKTHPTESTIQECVELYKTVSDPRIKLHTMYIVATEESYSSNRTYQQLAEQTIINSTGLKFIYMVHPDEMLEDLVQRIYTKIPDHTESIEDIRSRVALACNDTCKGIDNPIVYSLDIKDMFYNLDVEVHKILAWLNLPIEEARYDNWLVVYKKWQLAQNFCTTIQ